MSDDAFTHDDERFKGAAHPGGVGISDAEAKYADLFTEVAWDGMITPEKRQRLSTAAQTFGLSPERAEQIEQALGAAHQVIEQREPSRESIDEELDPLVDAKDPRLLALQMRIHHLEEEHAAGARDNARLSDMNEGLETLVGQLQNALESTLNELDEVHRELASKEQAAREAQASTPAPEAASMPVLTDSGPPPASIERPSSARPSMPFKQSPSAPGLARPTSEDDDNFRGSEHEHENEHEHEYEYEYEHEEAPASAAPQMPDAPPTTRGFAAPGGEDAGHVADAPAPPQSMAYKRVSSRRVLASATRAGPMAAIRARRENPVEVHRLLCTRPRDAELVQQLYRSLQRADDVDRRWCTAQALVYLGAADDEVRENYLAHVAPGLVRPTRAVNDDEWRELLFHPHEEPLTGEILSCIAPAVLLGQMTARKKRAPELDPAQRVEPKSSTLQAVRCMEWAAAFLGLAVPPIYACPEHEGLADIVLSPTPSTQLGKHALVGRSSKELAFIAGRHLTWYRQEHLLGKPTRSVRRLEDTFLAALMIGNPGLPIAHDVKQRVEPLVQMIRPLVSGETVAKLQHCFTRFVEHGGRTSLSRWYRGVERTSACTGLLLANDLHVAEHMLRLEPTSTPEAVDEAMGELVVFFTAGRCSIMRKRIGIAVS